MSSNIEWALPLPTTKVFSAKVFSHQSFLPPKFCDIRYVLTMLPLLTAFLCFNGTVQREMIEDFSDDNDDVTSRDLDITEVNAPRHV